MSVRRLPVRPNLDQLKHQAKDLLTALRAMGLLTLESGLLIPTPAAREHLVPGLSFAFAEAHAHGAMLFFLFYFIATALHALHVAIGIIVLLYAYVFQGAVPHGVKLHM